MEYKKKLFEVLKDLFDMSKIKNSEEFAMYVDDKIAANDDDVEMLIYEFDIFNNYIDEEFLYENIDEIIEVITKKYQELYEVLYEDGYLFKEKVVEDRNKTDFTIDEEDILQDNWIDIESLPDDLIVSCDLGGMYTATKSSRKKDRRFARDIEEGLY